MKMNPNRAKKANATETLPAVNRMLVNTPTSSIGWSLRRSHRTNAVNNAMRERERHEARRRRPAVLRPFDDRPHQHGDAGDRQRDPERIEAADRVVARCRHDPPDRDHGDDDHRHVDQEHRTPEEVLEQVPAGHRPERDGQAAGRRPDRDGDRPLAGVGEHVDQQRQRGGEDQRCADAHRRSPGDQLRRAWTPARPGSTSHRTPPCRSSACPCGRSGHRCCRPPSAVRRTPARRRRRSTATGWSSRRAHARTWAARRSRSCRRRR